MLVRELYVRLRPKRRHGEGEEIGISMRVQKKRTAMNDEGRRTLAGRSIDFKTKLIGDQLRSTQRKTTRRRLRF